MAPLAPSLSGAEWIGGEEICPTTGNRHIQGYVEFPLKVRPAGYKGMPNGIHWEKCKGDRQANVAYCSKEGKTQGTLRGPRQIKWPTFDKDWEIDILAQIKEEPDDRTIHWYWSAGGNIGKTTFCKYLVREHKACLLAGKGADVRNGALTHMKDKGAYPDLCVFPVPRTHNQEYLSYEAIENVKDACFYSGKYEGGSVAEPCPHLYVFANFPPDETKMSADRWHVVNIDEGI